MTETNELKNSQFTLWLKGSPLKAGINKDLPTADYWLNKASGEGNLKCVVSKIAGGGMKMVATSDVGDDHETNFYTRQYIRPVLAASKKIYLARVTFNCNAGGDEIKDMFYINARFNNSDPGGDSKRRIHLVNTGKDKLPPNTLIRMSLQLDMPDLSKVTLKKDKDEGLEVAYLLNVEGKRTVTNLISRFELLHIGTNTTGKLKVGPIVIEYPATV